MLHTFDPSAYGKPRSPAPRALAKAAEDEASINESSHLTVSATKTVPQSRFPVNGNGLPPNATESTALKPVVSLTDPVSSEVQSSVARAQGTAFATLTRNKIPSILITTPYDVKQPLAQSTFQSSPSQTNQPLPNRVVPSQDTQIRSNSKVASSGSPKGTRRSLGSTNIAGIREFQSRSGHHFESRIGSGAVFEMERSNQIIAKNDRLKELQDASLRQITRKSAARRGKDNNNSVSIRDLDLARAPVNPDEPKTSRRGWAQDSPLHEESYHRESAPASSHQKDLSIVPQASSTSISQMPLRESFESLPTGTRRLRWAVKDETKAEKAETDGNDRGSAVPSDETRHGSISDDSLGKLMRRKQPAEPDEPLYDWEGKMVPPPEDWAERRRYNNNNMDFKAQFRSYIRDVQDRFGNGVPICPVSKAQLEDPHNHPDGIGMRHRTGTINIENAAIYGYQDPESAVMYARSINDVDYEGDCKLDSADEGNANFNRDETTQQLVSNWNKHIANSRGDPGVRKLSAPTRTNKRSQDSDIKYIEVQRSSSTDNDKEEEGVPLLRPKLNIYLRPATQADLRELTRIYNYYVARGCQTPELRKIDESEMASRMEYCSAGKLPFLVAAKKSQRRAKPTPSVDDKEMSRRSGLPVTHQKHIALSRIEELAGFCCVNDFTQPDYVEHISADIEIYVDFQYKNQGVGKSLMDKMLQICDPRHQLAMNVPFHCDEGVGHLYSPGGGRDLHKLVIIVRKWHQPKLAQMDVEGPRGSGRFPFTRTCEDDYGRWLRKWLESLGFEVEGHLKKVGAKHGRYIDHVYFSRETSWQPTEGDVPDPSSDHMGAAVADSPNDG